ncbi:MAG: VWA domain-containing protein, partial [Paracoccaceae bacterium]
AALRLARAIRDRRSRRRRAARRGAALDMARVLRRSLARGGDPVALARKRRPERPMRLVVLCDVSGSMEVHARVFLAFVRGLVSADARAQAFLFHTRLVAITAALAERDPFRAATRLSLMAEGFGGGTDIGGCLTRFCEHHAARAVNGRTVVVILSDGYCSGAPEAVGGALARLGRRAGRIVWLSPLDADPAPAAIEAARPRLDALLFATTIDALGALEAEFARL